MKIISLLSSTLPGPSTSEVMTLWCYTNILLWMTSQQICSMSRIAKLQHIQILGFQQTFTGYIYTDETMTEQINNYYVYMFHFSPHHPVYDIWHNIIAEPWDNLTVTATSVWRSDTVTVPSTRCFTATNDSTVGLFLQCDIQQIRFIIISRVLTRPGSCSFCSRIRSAGGIFSSLVWLGWLGDWPDQQEGDENADVLSPADKIINHHRLR